MMARTPSRSDITTINLNRLLSRLDERLPLLTHTRPYEGTGGTVEILLHTENRDKIPNVIERRKIATNLEYARKLLLQLETEYASVKDGRIRKKMTEDVGRWKGRIRKLNERCQFLEEMEGEIGGENQTNDDGKEINNETISTAAGITDPEAAAVLRNRLKGASTHTPTATSTALLPLKQNGTLELVGDKNLSSLKHNATTKDLDTLLTVESTRQENLTNDLLRMARLLKESSLAFGKHLEDEKPHLEQAAQGLDKTAQEMQVTGGRMDLMRRDSTVGWYKQLVYLVSIAGLMILCLIMLIMPKLRI